MFARPNSPSQPGRLRAYRWRVLTVLTAWAVLFAVLAGKEKEQDRRVAGLVAAIDDREAAIGEIDQRVAEQRARWQARHDEFYRGPGRSERDCAFPAFIKPLDDEIENSLGERKKAEARITRPQTYLAVARHDGHRAFARWLAIAVAVGLAALAGFYFPFRKGRGTSPSDRPF